MRTIDPIWDETREIPCNVDPDTGWPLRAWDDVLDELGPCPASSPRSGRGPAS